jgi:hypothetical protein
MTPLTAEQALERHFLDIRCRLLDLAAALDRINRGENSGKVDDDPRVERIHQALEVLSDRSGGRAERIQQIFSLDYDPAWKRPDAK